MYKYEYPRPAIAADCVVFTFDGKEIKVLLIQRKNEPFRSKWALPGGFVEEGETCEAAAVRELAEETGLTVKKEPELVNVFSAPGRDPRGWIITTAYYFLIKSAEIKPADDAADVQWFSLKKLPELAFDHQDVLKAALKKLRLKADSRPIGKSILKPDFEFTQIHSLYESIFGKAINIRTLQRKLLKVNLLAKSPKIDVKSKRSAKLYRFDEKMYQRLSKSGFCLGLNEKE